MTRLRDLNSGQLELETSSTAAVSVSNINQRDWERRIIEQDRTTV